MNLSQEPKKAIYQHILPVLIKETGIVFGCVSIPYTRFVSVKEWNFWPKMGPTVIQCVTTPEGKQYMALVLSKFETRKVQLITGFISTRDIDYVSVWRTTKAVTVHERSLGMLNALINHFTFDSEDDYIRNTEKRDDHIDKTEDGESTVVSKCKDLKWKIKINHQEFCEDFGFSDVTWLEFFKKSCSAKKIEDIPISVSCLQSPEGIKVSFIYDVLQAVDSEPVPALMRLLKINHIDKGVYPCVIMIAGKKANYRVTINMVVA